jgi:hypothetical protein
MPVFKWITITATFSGVIAFVCFLFVYGRQVKKRITYLPEMQKAKPELLPYY